MTEPENYLSQQLSAIIWFAIMCPYCWFWKWLQVQN